jgi:hypothetical protein
VVSSNGLPCTAAWLSPREYLKLLSPPSRDDQRAGRPEYGRSRPPDRKCHRFGGVSHAVWGVPSIPGEIERSQRTSSFSKTDFSHRAGPIEFKFGENRRRGFRVTI